MRQVLFLLLGTIGLWCATGCAAKGPMTPGEVWGFCMSADYHGQDTCAWKEEVCDAYKQLLQQEYADAKACRSACYGVQTRFLRNAGAYGCTHIFNQGASYCSAACNDKYQPDEAEPPEQ